MRNSSYHDYDEVYGVSDEYYWGVKPSYMCLKIIELMPPDKYTRVLDIGCGEGKDSVFLARCGYDVSAFDLSDTGVEKTKKLAERANVKVNVFKANIWDYRLNDNYDILFSSGVLHYIKPELRDEVFGNYLTHTNENGLNVFNVFIKKPFITPAPENEEHSYLWSSGQLLAYYSDWYVEDFSEFVFDCNSSEVPHQHAMNSIFARKK
ncbi:MAG: class I SAM-dependent methyltransferase [Oscillospiraceae bacterium]|jgi:tellurite methyltransferase|nr:class I SAM-dependent methyltransferase [Oscillospiraceae bacterium]